MASVLTCCLLMIIFYLSTVSAQTFSFSQPATGPSSVREGSNVTLQCVIVINNPDNTVTVQSTVWSRDGMPVQVTNSSGTFTLPNHNQVFNSTTGGLTDLVITNVTLEDNNTVYTCTATGAPITSNVVLIVAAIDQVAGANLTCKPVGLMNQCNATWLAVTHEDTIGYEVCNGTIMNGTIMNETIMTVNGANNTMLLFTAPPVDNDVVTEFTIVIMVRAINRFRAGPFSDPANATIDATSVTDGIIFVFDDLDFSISILVINATHYNITGIIDININFTAISDSINDPMVNFTAISDVTIMESLSNTTDITTVMDVNQTSDTYNMTLICSFHNDSEADMVEVIAMPDEGKNMTNTSQVSNRVGMVTIDELKCETNYTVMAGGMINKTLIGPRIILNEIRTGSCEPEVSSDQPTTQPTTQLTTQPTSDNDNTVAKAAGGAAGGVLLVVVGIIGAVLFVIWLQKRKKRKLTETEASRSLSKVKPSEIDSKTKEIKTEDTHQQQQQQQQQEYAVVDKSKKIEKPNQKQNTELNYLGPDDLEIQKGPEIRFKTDHTVQYGQFDDTT